MGKFNESVKIVRIVNCLMAMVGIVIGAILTRATLVYYPTAVASLAAFAVCAAGNVHNDLLDIEADRINRPNRVLVRGALSQRYAQAMVIALNILALVLALTVNVAVVVAVVLAISMLAAYNRYLQRLPLVGNIVVASLGALTFITGAAAADPTLAPLIPGPLIAASIAFFFHLSREVVKDIEDIAGDNVAGVLTIPQKIGPRKAAILALCMFLGAASASIVPVITGWFSPAYAVISIYVVNLPLLGLLIAHALRPSVFMSRIVSKALKIGMGLGIVALSLA